MRFQFCRLIFCRFSQNYSTPRYSSRYRSERDSDIHRTRIHVGGIYQILGFFMSKRSQKYLRALLSFFYITESLIQIMHGYEK